MGGKIRVDRGSIRRKSQQVDAGGTKTHLEEPTRGSGIRFQVPVRRKTSNTEQPQIKSPPSVTPNTREAIVYSPASSTFSMTSVSSTRGKGINLNKELRNVTNYVSGTPCSDMFFASGNTTPSHVASPPPNQTHFGSPMFSPPTSPPPLTTVTEVPKRGAQQGKVDNKKTND